MPPVEHRETPKSPAETQTNDAAAIKQILREVTNASFTKGGFDDIVERFTEADRTRLNRDAFTEQEHETLDGRLAQIQKDWQAKYNQDFNLTNAAQVFGMSFVAITQQPAAVTAGERRPATPADDPARRTGNAPAPERRPDTGDAAQFGDDAAVRIAASHNLPEVTFNMRREAMGRWKIDVPDTYTSRQLHDNLLKQLTTFNEQKASWPENQDEAYRMASHRVLLAVTGTGDKPGEMKPADIPARLPQDRAPLPRPSDTPAPRP
jgi:hypothetical protein